MEPEGRSAARAVMSEIQLRVDPACCRARASGGARAIVISGKTAQMQLNGRHFESSIFDFNQ